jgi:hypothetical protein
MPGMAIVLFACLAVLARPVAAQVFDDFESYAVSSNLHGQGGWAGWMGNASAGALVSTNFSFSPIRSVNITGASDLVHTFSGATNGQWVFSVMQYIPSSSTGDSYVILMNTYQAPYATSNLSWSVQIQCNMATGQIISDYGGGATLPMLKDQWVEFRCEVNLASNSVSEFYNGQLLSTHLWQGGGGGPGLNEIQALDLFANNAGPVYYDNVSLALRGCVPPPANMVAWWPFDESNGATSLLDIVGGNNATPFASPVGAAQAPQPITGVVNGAIDFPKFGGSGFSGARVVSPSGALLGIGSGDFTIDAWVKFPPSSAANRLHYIVNKFDTTANKGYSLYVISPGSTGNERLEFKWGDGSNLATVQTISPITPNQWHHVAVIFGRNVGGNALDIRLYVNGLQQGMQQGNPPSLGSLANFLTLEIGWQPSTLDEPISLDELEIFSRALMLQEIQGIFNAGPAGKCKPPCLTVTCPPDKTVQCGTTWSFDLPTATSCCGTNITILPFPFEGVSGPCPWTYTQGWTITDNCSNSASCLQHVTVVDTNPPVLLCATNKTVCGDYWTFDPPTAYDACCGANVTVSVLSTVTNRTSPLVVTRFWTATDCCGNSTTCAQTVTVLLTNCCLTLSNESVVCAGNGTYTYSFDFRNDSGQTAYSLLMADVNENPVFADPLIYFTPPLPTGQTRHLSVTIVSDTCGQLCFYLVPHNESFEDCCSRTHCITLPGCCSLPRTYNSTADFAKGTLLNLTDQNNQLCFPDHITPFPYVNMACSGRGTIVRIDVNTGAVLGEYKTAPDSDYPGGPLYDLSHKPPYKYGPNPSRTTVDLLGNVWVANRGVNKNNYGTVTRYALVIGGTRVDFNGMPNPNGQYLKPPFSYNSGAKSRHTRVSGEFPGLLKTSRGLGDILPWLSDIGNGIVTFAADDDCIINYTVVTWITGSGFGILESGIRTIAVDCTNDVWIGGTKFMGANGVHLKLSGVTALPIAVLPFIGPNFAGGYGGLIDGNNVLWSARGASQNLLRVDLNNLTLGLPPPCLSVTGWFLHGCDLGSACGNYGLSVDPCTGNIWHTTVSWNTVYVRGPDGTCLHSFSEMNPNGPGGNTAQGVAVDEHGNVWIAHAIGNVIAGHNEGANTVGHITTTGIPVGLSVGVQGVVNLPNPPSGGHGPTGVAIDSNGKVWVSCYDSSKAMRIDPNGGLNDPATSRHVGAVDLVVDLNTPLFTPPTQYTPYTAATPYNYSDKTGFTAIGVTCPSGFWDFVQDGCTAGADWGILSWTVSSGTQITVEVRAADNVTDPMTGLPSKLWTTVQNGVSFCGSGVTGQYLEVRVTLQRGITSSCTPSTACLQSLTVQCCSTPPCWPGPPCWFKISLPGFVSVSNSVALTTNLSAVITQPSGLPTLVTWSVNGQVVQTNQIPGGPAPTQTTVDFVHTYQPGSNWVEVTASDGINPPVYAFTSVTVGDINPPTWQTLNAYETNAFVAVIPDVVASLNTNLLSDDWSSFGQIRVVQYPPAGMVVTQGVYWITLVARDAAGNQSTNSTSLAVGPVVTILSPDEYASFPTNTGTPVTVQIAANVADVVRVNYYLDANLVATSSNAPFSVNLTNVPAGAYSLTAEAVNPGGLTSRSLEVPVYFISPQPVRIEFQTTTNGLILNWPSGWTLQSASSVLGPWSDVPGATSPYTVIAASAQKFFRLRQ